VTCAIMAVTQEAVLLRIGEFELDPARFVLSRRGRTIKLELLPMELLILLVEQRGRMVTRDEIVGRLWGKDKFLDVDNSINTAIRKISVRRPGGYPRRLS
jgi:DNA-binding response OmpR family regulator